MQAYRTIRRQNRAPLTPGMRARIKGAVYAKHQHLLKREVKVTR